MHVTQQCCSLSLSFCRCHILHCEWQAADQALAASTQSRPHVRPINPKEASRGKVDYVQVGSNLEHVVGWLLGELHHYSCMLGRAVAHCGCPDILLMPPSSILLSGFYVAPLQSSRAFKQSRVVKRSKLFCSSNRQPQCQPCFSVQPAIYL